MRCHSVVLVLILFLTFRLAGLTAQSIPSSDSLCVLTWNVTGLPINFGAGLRERVVDFLRISGADIILWQGLPIPAEGRENIAAASSRILSMGFRQDQESPLGISSRLNPRAYYSAHRDRGMGARFSDSSGREITVFSLALSEGCFLPWEVLKNRTLSDEQLLLTDTEVSGRFKEIQGLLDHWDRKGFFELGSPLIVGGSFQTPSHLDWVESVNHLRPHRRPLNLPVSQVMANVDFKDTFRMVHSDPAATPGDTFGLTGTLIPGTTLQMPPERVDRIYVRQRTRQNFLVPVGARTFPDVLVHLTVDVVVSHAPVLSMFRWISDPDFDATGLMSVDDGHHAAMRPGFQVDLGEFESRPLRRLAFGSCFKEMNPCPILDVASKEKPQLYLALGDNIYGDTVDMELLRIKYRRLARHPAWKRFTADTRVLGTWDDHDYGMNDAGASYPRKSESKELLLEFFGEPQHSSRRVREGVYTAYELGPPEQRVQVLLLDLRSFRTLQSEVQRPAYASMGNYRAAYDDEPAAMLGETQWLWLADELKRSAVFRIIGHSSQFGVGFNGHESWANYPRERERMFQLLKDVRAEGVFMISGDTHWAEANLREVPGLYPIFDLTSSALNQKWSAPGVSDTRIGSPLNEANIGMIDFEWTPHDPVLTAKILDVSGSARWSLRVCRSELSFAPSNLMSRGIRGEGILGSWHGESGPLTIERMASGKFSLSYSGGRAVLREYDGKFVGSWVEKDRSGPCRFELSRCGRFLKGVRGVGENPMLISWSAWRADPAEFMSSNNDG